MNQKKLSRITLAIFALVFTGLSLSSCTQPAEDPKTIADQYWQHIQAGNSVEAEKLVSMNSRRALTETQHQKINIEQFSNAETHTIVSTTITTISPKNLKQSRTFNTYLVLQQGQWKVDANQTQIPPAPSATEEELQQLAEELSESMQDNIDSIDEAMNQGMQLLNEALRDGSKEMGDSLLHLMNDLNSSMHDSIDKMKQRREQQLQEKQKPQQTDPTEGEGRI